MQRMQSKEYQDVIDNIDWDLLQHQKKTLEKLLTTISFHPAILNEDINDLWGLIELIENLQDVHENDHVKNRKKIYPSESGIKKIVRDIEKPRLLL